MTLTQSEILALCEQLAKAAEDYDQALKLIAEDASRGQKERLPLIQDMAERARRKQAVTMERLSGIREAYGEIK